MSLNVNLIDCPYLYAVAKTLQMDEGNPKLDYRAFRTELNRLRKEKGWPEAEDTFLFSSGDPLKSQGFIDHMRSAFGFKVNFQDRNLAMSAHVRLPRGHLRFDDISRRMAGVLGRGELSEEMYAEEANKKPEVAVMILSGSFNCYDAIYSISNPRYHANCMMVTFEDYADRDLYVKAGLETKRSVSRIQHHDLSNRAEALFGQRIWEDSAMDSVIPGAISDV